MLKIISVPKELDCSAFIKQSNNKNIKLILYLRYFDNKESFRSISVRRNKFQRCRSASNQVRRRTLIFRHSICVPWSSDSVAAVRGIPHLNVKKINQSTDRILSHFKCQKRRNVNILTVTSIISSFKLIKMYWQRKPLWYDYFVTLFYYRSTYFSIFWLKYLATFSLQQWNIENTFVSERLLLPRSCRINR